MLEIKNIRKSFDGQEILKGVDIKVEKGDVVTILGPSVRERPPFCVVSIFLKSRMKGRWFLTRST